MPDLGHALLGLACLAGLVYGAEQVVDNCIALMEKKGLSGSFLGLVVISVGTSLPELLTHVSASIDILAGRLDYRSASATVLGMNVGSDIVQECLLIGVVGLFGLLKVSTRFIWRDVLVLILGASAMWGFAADGGGLSRLEGGLLVFGYLFYLLVLVRERHGEDAADEAQTQPDPADRARGPLGHWLWIGGGLGVVLVSAHFLLQSVQYFVERFGIGGSLIGVAVLGVATALPELSTAISSIRRKQSALSIGTLVGSNITNPMLAIGTGALISTYAVPQVLIVYDLPVKIGAALLLFVLFLWDRKLSRIESSVLIAIYVVYLATRVWLFPEDTYG